MPRNVTGVALGKSTYARAGLLVNTTPLEAGWTGRLVATHTDHDADASLASIKSTSVSAIPERAMSAS